MTDVAPAAIRYITDPKVDTYRNQLVMRGYHPGIFNLLKEVGGRYSSDAKGVVFPPYRSYGLWLKESFSDCRWTETAEALMEEPEFSSTITIHEPTEGWHKLYPYQKQAVDFLHKYRHGGLEALSPGLGKTAVSLIAADMLDLTNVLIVAPLSLLRTWEKETKKWTHRVLERRWGSPPPSADAMKGAKAKGTYNWIVTNYDTVVRDVEYRRRIWDLVIFDESVLLKNRKTKRFASAKELVQFSRRVWLLSGSPTSKYADDLWGQLHLIDQNGWPSYWRFVSRCCYVEESVWGKKIVGTKPSINFPTEFSDIMFVRNQKDVLPDLPDMLFDPIEVDLRIDQIKAHRELVEGMVENLETGEEMKVPEKIAQLTRMQQVTSNLCNMGPEWNDSSGKVDMIMEMIENDAVEFPIIIWTHWIPGANSLTSRLKSDFKSLRVGQVNGRMDASVNEDTFERFKDGRLDVLVLALGVGKFGHTLVNARTVVYLDKTWDADAYNQSLHRVKRIGLTHSPRIISLNASGTVDDIVEANLVGKLGSIAKVSNADLKMMLKSLL